MWDFWTSGAFVDYLWPAALVAGWVVCIAPLFGRLVDYLSRCEAEKRIGERLDEGRADRLRVDHAAPQQFDPARGRADVAALYGLRTRVERRRSERPQPDRWLA
jgi:hypothetical protein